jgi:8-oxo-dGTP diphosphatase
MKLIQKAIIKKGDKFLILLRSSDSEFFPEDWDFPGGKLEFGEDPLIGIEREVVEETDLKIKVLKVVGTYELDSPRDGKKFPHRFTVYSADLISGEVKLSHEHLDFKWVTKEEMLKLKIEPYMKLYIEGHP